MTTPTRTAAPGGLLKGEASIRLPTLRLVLTNLIAGGAVTTAWFAAAKLLEWPIDRVQSVLAGAGIATLMSLVSILILAPWKVRPIGIWMSFWMGGTVFRLLLTPVAAYLLYSAASLSRMDVGWSVATAFLAVLFSEAIVLSLFLNRHAKPLVPPAPIPGAADRGMDEAAS